MLFRRPQKISILRGALIAAHLSAIWSCAKGGSDTSPDQPAAAPPVASTTQPVSTPPATAASPNDNAGPAEPTTKPVAWPNLNFVNDPGGYDTKAVALTFDDGPDGSGSVEGKAGKSNMSRVLDQLDALGLKATFFLCGNLTTNVLTDAMAQADVKRMVASGHHYGSHTATHPTFDPSSVSVQRVSQEFANNQTIFTDPKLFGPSYAFTMFRSPYGVPFQDGIAFPPTAASVNASVGVLAPGTPPNAVHVGWGIDTKDWQCAQSNSDSNCIMNNLNLFLDRGASGPILMHSIYKLTADTLPQIVASIYKHNYHIVMVEDMIKAKYGASSAAIARGNATTTFDADTMSRAAVAATMQSKWFLQANEN